MHNFMTLKDGRNIFFRAVGTDKSSGLAREDYQYCYDLAKRTVMDDVTALAGFWPEAQQQEFFSLDFYEDDTYILFEGNRRIGCFSIHESDKTIDLKKAYIEPVNQGVGLWSKMLEMGLAMAHEKKKPLEMAVLISNKDMLATAQKYGFLKTDDFTHKKASWVQMTILSHKDTLHFAVQKDIL